MAENSNYKIHLYTFLCEGAIVVFNSKKVKFNSFPAFCHHYSILMEQKELGRKELSVLKDIYDHVNPLLALGYESFLKHLYELFSMKTEDLSIYIKIVRYRTNISV